MSVCSYKTRNSLEVEQCELRLVPALPRPLNLNLVRN